MSSQESPGKPSSGSKRESATVGPNLRSRAHELFLASTNDGKPFTSIKGSIIVAKSLRPSITLRLADGRPHLLIEISAFQLLGSIGEVSFWETTSLESELGLLPGATATSAAAAAVAAALSNGQGESDEEAKSRRRLKRWFVKGVKALRAREEERQARFERKKRQNEQQIRQRENGASIEGMWSAQPRGANPADVAGTAPSSSRASPRPPSVPSGIAASTLTSSLSTESPQSSAPPSSIAATVNRDEAPPPAQVLRTHSPLPSAPTASEVPILPTLTAGTVATDSKHSELAFEKAAAADDPWADFDLEKEAQQLDLVPLDAIQRDDGAQIPASIGSSTDLPGSSSGSLEDRNAREEQRGRNGTSISLQEESYNETIPATLPDAVTASGVLPERDSTTEVQGSASATSATSMGAKRAVKVETTTPGASTMPDLILSGQSLPFFLNGEREDERVHTQSSGNQGVEKEEKEEEIRGFANGNQRSVQRVDTPTTGAEKHPTLESVFEATSAPTSSAPSSSQQSDIPIKEYKTVVNAVRLPSMHRQQQQTGEGKGTEVLNEGTQGRSRPVEIKTTAKVSNGIQKEEQLSPSPHLPQKRLQFEESKDSSSSPRKLAKSATPDGSGRSNSVVEDKKSSGNKELLRKLLESKRKQREENIQEAQRRYEESHSKIIY